MWTGCLARSWSLRMLCPITAVTDDGGTPQGTGRSGGGQSYLGRVCCSILPPGMVCLQPRHGVLDATAVEAHSVHDCIVLRDAEAPG